MSSSAGPERPVLPKLRPIEQHKKLSLDDFVNEFFAGIFAYDSRLYRTLGALLLKPGKISKDYIEGKRVRYANPYRFYLSASIIFFLVWSIPRDFDSITSNINPEEAALVDSTLTRERAENPHLDSLLVHKLPLISIAGTTTEKEIFFYPEKDLDTLSLVKRTGKKLKVFFNFYERKKIRNVDKALEELGYRSERWNRWLYKKTVDAHIFINQPGLFVNYFVSKLPFIIFFYLPVFAFFIWPLYLNRPFTYMEHLIFTFHNQTTWFVMFGIAFLLGHIFNTGWFSSITVFLFLFYLYKAFRRFYQQGRVKTILKFIIINIIFFTLAIVAAIFSILASFAIY